VPRSRDARVAVLGGSVQRSAAAPYPSRSRSVLRRRVIVAVLVVVSITLITISFRSPTSGPLHDAQGVGSSVLHPFQVAADRVAQPFRDVYGYFSGLAGAKKENKKLRKEVTQLRAQLAATIGDARENANLKALLHYEQGPTFPVGYRAVNTRVLASPTDPFRQQVVIAAGRNRGVRLNAPVVTADGLVGEVSNVFPDSAQVTLLTDPTSAVSAYDATSPGAVKGLLQHSAGSTLNLQRVNKDQVVNKGDVIVTAGTLLSRLPDLFPRNIPIGTVSFATNSDVALYKTIQVNPYVAFGSLDSVAVLVR
jgi:rod shape-determining protein MreC